MFYFIWKEGTSHAEEVPGSLLTGETTFCKLEYFLEDKSGFLLETGSCSVVRLTGTHSAVLVGLEPRAFYYFCLPSAGIVGMSQRACLQGGFITREGK